MKHRKQIRIAKSAITDTIFAGHVLKDGKTWAANQTDVTSDFWKAVVEIVGVGYQMDIRVGGKPKYRVILEEIV